MNQNIVTSASLHFREGSSDKVYHAAVESKDDGYIVTFSYGRRGNTLTTGTKTDDPLPLETASKVFDKLIASKVAKGYQPDGQPATPYQQSGDEGRDTGIRCQLLNAVDQSELTRLLNDRKYCIQEKHDGRRLLVRTRGKEVTGINRRGLIVAIPEPIRQAVLRLPLDVLIDGEAVGDTFHVFDLLEIGGHDYRERRYIDRIAALLNAIPTKEKAIRPVATYILPVDKLRVFDEMKTNNKEGVVFKDTQATYAPGRPTSGGPQLKFKFIDSASFIVTAGNKKRSVTLGLHHGDKIVFAGNVSIPSNHDIPNVGDVVDVRYLHAFPESGAIYQPVYLGKRDDVPTSDCVVTQLKYKNFAGRAA